MKSATFRLSTNKEIKIKIEKNNMNEDLEENDTYYIEKSFTENHKNVYHLIMARKISSRRLL